MGELMRSWMLLSLKRGFQGGFLAVRGLVFQVGFLAEERTSTVIVDSAASWKTTGAHVAKRVAGLLREVDCIHGVVVVKRNQEPALRFVVVQVADGNGR